MHLVCDLLYIDVIYGGDFLGNCVHVSILGCGHGRTTKNHSKGISIVQDTRTIHKII